MISLQDIITEKIIVFGRKYNKLLALNLDPKADIHEPVNVVTEEFNVSFTIVYDLYMAGKVILAIYLKIVMGCHILVLRNKV